MTGSVGNNNFDILPEDIAGGIYLDLDDTLFDTYAAWTLIWQKVAEIYPSVNPDKESSREQLRRYYVQPQGSSFAMYDFRVHLDDLGLGDKVDDIYYHIKKSELADGRFEFEGVNQLIECAENLAQYVAILTFGLDEIQRFKKDLCPSVSDLKMITTLEYKADFFKKNNIRNAVLIDDKPIGHDLAEAGIKFIQILHSDKRRQEEPPRPWPVVSSLSEAMLILQKSLLIPNPDNL